MRIWNYILSGNSNNYICTGETLRIEKFALQLRWKNAKHTFLWLVTKQLIKMYGILMRGFAYFDVRCLALWRLSRKSYYFRSYLRNCLHVMEPGGLLPCLQEPTAFPVLILKNPVRVILSWSFRSILIYPSRLRLGLPSGLFPSGCSTIVLYAFITKV